MDDSWLSEKYPVFRVFAKEIAKLELVEAVYGIRTEFDPTTGGASISEKDRKE
jgi:hypothetical protein